VPTPDFVQHTQYALADQEFYYPMILSLKSAHMCVNGLKFPALPRALPQDTSDAAKE